MITSSMLRRGSRAAAAMLCALLVLIVPIADSFAAATVTGIQLLNSVRSGRTTFDFTYRIQVQNGTPSLNTGLATVTSSAPGTVILKSSVALGTVAANTAVTSTDTFTLRQSRLSAFDPSKLTWTVTDNGGNSTPASLSLALSQLVIGAGGNVSITAKVLNSAGQPIVPSPVVNYSITGAANGSGGTLPVVNGQQLLTSISTRGGFSLEGTIANTSVKGRIAFTVLQNSTQSKNAGVYVSQAAAQSSVAQNLATIARAIESGNTSEIPGASAALSAAAASVNLNALALSTPYEPDTGFVPSASVLASRGFPPSAGDAGFTTLTAQLRAKLQAITQLLDQPGANADANTAALAQHVAELQTLRNQLLAAANRPGPHGIVSNASPVFELLTVDMPKVLQAVEQRINSELRLAGLLATYDGPASMYAGVGPNSLTQLAGGRDSAGEMYSETRPVFFVLTGLLGALGPMGELVVNVYGDYINQLETMTLLLGLQGALDQFLNGPILVGGLLTGASQSFHIYHRAGSLIYIGGISQAEAIAGDVFLIGGAARNALNDVISAANDGRNARSIHEIYDLFQKIVESLKEAYAAAHQNPNSLLSTSFEGGGCLLSSIDPCIELRYDSGFGYVGSGGPINLEPVIVLVRTKNPLGARFGSAIFNFSGR